LKAVLFYVFKHRPLVGSLFNAFEYFMKAYELDKEVKLIFVCGSKEDIEYYMSIFENRYDLSGLDDIRSNIITIKKRTSIVRHKFETVLVVDYSTINMTRGLFLPNKIVVISEKYTENPDFFYRKDFYNVIYYGEMPFHYRDINYRMKFLFERYKPLSSVEEAIYINSPNATDYDFVKELDLQNKPLIFKSRTSHLTNMFEKFDTYVYYHSNAWFDPHPRLMIESTFYEKEVLYFNKYKVKDGSYYRFEDLKQNGLNNRNLTEDDEVIMEFLK